MPFTSIDEIKATTAPPTRKSPQIERGFIPLPTKTTIPPLREFPEKFTKGIKRFIDTWKEGTDVIKQTPEQAAKDILERGLTPPFQLQEAKSWGEWLGNVAKGGVNLALLPVQMPAQLAHSLIGHPAQKAIEETYEGGIKGVAKGALKYQIESSKGLLETVTGFGEFFLNPIGYQGYKKWAENDFKGKPEIWAEMKKQWKTDPVFSVVAIVGVKSMLKQAKARGRHPAEYIDEIKSESIITDKPAGDIIKEREAVKPDVTKPPIREVEPPVRAVEPEVTPVADKITKNKFEGKDPFEGISETEISDAVSKAIAEGKRIVEEAPIEREIIKEILNRPEEIAKRMAIKKEIPPESVIERKAKKLGINLEQERMKLAQEMVGEGILDEISAQGITPQKIITEYFSEIYPEISKEAKTRVHKSLTRQTGMEPGDTLWIDREGNKGIAKNYKEIADFFAEDLPRDALDLEGTQRGFIVLLHEAIKRKKGKPTPLEITEVKPPVRPPVEEVTIPLREISQPREIFIDVPPSKITEFIDPLFREEGFIRIGKGKPETQFTGDALKVEKMYDKATAAIKQKHKKTLRQTGRILKRNIVDVSGNLKKELMRQGDAGKKVVMHHDLIAGSNSKAMRDNQLASNKIFKGLSNLEHEVLDRIIQSRRTIAIEQYKEIKHPGGLGRTEHQAWLEQLPLDLKSKLNKRADSYFEAMRNQLKQLRDENIISEASYNSLLESGDYSPRRFLQHIDPDITYTIGGRKITVPDSGIKSLDEGSFGLLEKDSSLLLSQVINRTQGRIFRNRANKSLYDLAVNYPDNGVVYLAEITGKTKAGQLKYQITPSGMEKIKVMIDGNPKEMLMPTDMAKEWITKDPILGQTQASIIRWMSGTAILKPMATGLNPEFAVTNFPRDLAHIWITDYRSAYSPHLPIAMGQMMRDLSTVSKDAISRKGRWIDYVNEGGGMEFLTHQGRITSKTQGAIKGIQTAMGYIGETSEIMPRLALRERALRKGYPSTEATWIARDYLDFSQGGSFVKAVDSGIPYLNASVQGTRGLFKSAGMKPSLFTYKVAQIGTLATSLFYMNKYLNEDAWEQVSSRDKVNNFIITTPYSYTDKEGNERYIYFKIAKDHGQRVFASIFEGLAARAIGDEVDGDQIAQAAQDAIPIIPSQSLPPTIDAFLGYTANKDFWRNKDIWRGPEVKPEEEYTPYTHPSFVRTGELTGLSPERLKYALTQYFTYGNIYTSMGGYAWKQILDDMPKIEREKVTEDIILRQPFIRRFAKKTDPYHKFQKKIDEARIEESTKRYILKREFDILSQQVYDGKISEKEINSFIYKLPRENRKSFKIRHRNRGRIQNIPDRRWWLNLAAMNPEARATVYWNRWRNADELEREKLDKYLRRVPGVLSTQFKRKLQRLKSKRIE